MNVVILKFGVAFGWGSLSSDIIIFLVSLEKVITLCYSNFILLRDIDFFLALRSEGGIFINEFSDFRSWDRSNFCRTYRETLQIFFANGENRRNLAFKLFGNRCLLLANGYRKFVPARKYLFLILFHLFVFTAVQVRGNLVYWDYIFSTLELADRHVWHSYILLSEARELEVGPTLPRWSLIMKIIWGVWRSNQLYSQIIIWWTCFCTILRLFITSVLAQLIKRCTTHSYRFRFWYLQI